MEKRQLKWLGHAYLMSHKRKVGKKKKKKTLKMRTVEQSRR